MSARDPETLPALSNVSMPSLKMAPFPSLGAPKSMRNFPGSSAASYQVSTFVVPSAL
jgi:hypothetical protein